MSRKDFETEKCITRIFTISPNKQIVFIGLGVLISHNLVLVKIDNEQKIKIEDYGKKLNQTIQFFIDFPSIKSGQLIKVEQLKIYNNNGYDLFKLTQQKPKDAKKCSIEQLRKNITTEAKAILSKDGKINGFESTSILKISSIDGNFQIFESTELFKQHIVKVPAPVFENQSGKLLGFLESQNEEGENRLIIIPPKPVLRNLGVSYFWEIFVQFFQQLPPFQFIFGLFGIAIFIISLSANIAGIINFFNPTYLSPMSSQLNIVVLPFATENCGLLDGRKIQREIPSQMATIIRESSRDFDIAFDVRDPSIYLFLPFRYSEFIAEKAARDNNAQIVIYGKVTCQKNNDAIVQTRLYISTENFGEALELIGENVAGQLDFADFTIYGGDQYSGNAYQAQQKDMLSRLKAYTTVIYGLGSYINQDPSAAVEYFSDALDKEYWANTNGQETIYLLLGNAYLRQATENFSQFRFDKIDSTLDTAEEFYYQANGVSIDNGKGDYARAYIGLSGVEQLRSILPLQAENSKTKIDMASLQNAVLDLQRAANSPNSPASADIGAKIDYGYAQIALIRYLVTGDLNDVAEADYYYKRVIDSQRRGKSSRISEIVALSYKGRALIAHREDLEQAISFLESAYSVARNRSLKAQILVMSGDFLLENGQLDLAIEKYQQAINMRSYLEKVVPESEILRIEELLIKLKENNQE